MNATKFVPLLLFLHIVCTGCTITNKYEPYYGRVVDAETKRPIEGAAVLAVYYTQQYGLTGSVAHYADAQETVTGKNGEFKLPARRIFSLNVISGWDPHPRFRIFKPGYGCYPRHKYATPKFDYGSLPPNQFVTIELPDVSREAREKRLENYGCYPSEQVPNKKYKILLNQEAVALGLRPDVEPKETQ
jgi:hypothetical protein